jgi:hypothetical protein
MRWLPLAAVAAAAVAVAAFPAIHSGSSSTGRPLVEPPNAGDMGFGVPVDVGKSVSISGPFVVENTGNRPIVLDRVELVGRQSGILLRGAYIVAYPDHAEVPRPRSATIGAVYGYGRSRDDRVLDGATVAPHTQIAIVLGVKATKPGRHIWSAVEVAYHDGHRAYLSRYGLSGQICAPEAKYAQKNGCPSPLDPGVARSLTSG